MKTSIFFGESKLCQMLRGQLTVIKSNHKYFGGVYAPPMYFKKMKHSRMNEVANIALVERDIFKYLNN